jgi:hypothetical protein
LFSFLVVATAAARRRGWVIRLSARATRSRLTAASTYEDLPSISAAKRSTAFSRHPVSFKYEPAPGDPDYRPDPGSTGMRQQDRRGERNDGDKAAVETSRQGASFQIKIGDPDRTISGQQRYVITYRLRGALNSFDDHLELYWNITGDGWPVPMERASAVIDAPSVTNAACFEGSQWYSQSCESGLSPNSARFNSRRTLYPGEGLTIVVGLTKGSVDPGGPLLVRRNPSGSRCVTSWAEAGADRSFRPPGPGLRRRLWSGGRGPHRWYGDSSI